jgi:hypothetical protein
MTIPKRSRWRPTVRHEYTDGPGSFCGLCGRRYGNPIHRRRRVMPPKPVRRPLCAVCGRVGYRQDLPGVAVVGHLDQRIKHSFALTPGGCDD